MGIVNPDARQFRIADVGTALAKRNQLEYGRLRNEALGMDVEEAQNMLANRKRAQEIRMEFEGTPDQIAQMEADGLFKEADELRNSYIAQAKAQVELSKAFSEGVTKENYDQVREGMINEGVIDPDLWPVEYDPNWFKDNNSSRAASLTKLTRKWYEDGAIMSQDIMQRGGEITWEGEPYEAPPTGGAKPKEYGAADNNAIGSEAAALFGGMYDPVTGNFQGLSRETAQQVTAIREEASQQYQRGLQTGEPITHSVAVAQAARKLKINIPNLEQMDNPNVLNLAVPDRLKN